MGLMSNIRQKGRKIYWKHLAGLLREGSRQCNLCLEKYEVFADDAWHENHICWNCRSEIRHRLLVAAMDHLDEASWKKIVKGKKILHFAPEPILAKRFQELSARYMTADFMREDVDFRLDISDMHQISDGEFDLVIACDVLEHVPEDRRALREIYRILTQGGVSILTVPQKDGAAVTFEDWSLTDPGERKAVFGQEDHVRIYGDDFASRVEEAGFHVVTVDHNAFREEIVQRHVLFPPRPSSHPLATNHRKVFIAQKLER